MNYEAMTTEELEKVIQDLGNQRDALKAEQQMAHDQQNMARQSQMDEQRMAQESEMMQREGAMKEQQMGQEMQHAERKSRLDELRQPQGNDQGGY